MEMNKLFDICVAISLGVMVGFVIGGLKLVVKRTYSQQQIRVERKIIDAAAVVLKYITFLLLALGLVWCIYFLILGAMVPAQTDYANNMAELIVSVLTVVSIIFAFVEFLKRTDHREP